MNEHLKAQLLQNAEKHSGNRMSFDNTKYGTVFGVFFESIDNALLFTETIHPTKVLSYSEPMKAREAAFMIVVIF